MQHSLANVLGNAQRYARTNQRPNRKHASLLRDTPRQQPARTLAEHVKNSRLLTSNVTLHRFNQGRRVEWNNCGQADADELMRNCDCILTFRRKNLTYHFSSKCCPNCLRVVLEFTSLKKETERSFCSVQHFSSAVSTTLAYFGHGVNLEMTSSTARVIPRTSRILPMPFHNVVTPCLWCRWTMTGTSVSGTMWYFLEVWWTWDCRRSTRNGWHSRFSVIKLIRFTLAPKYFRREISATKEKQINTYFSSPDHLAWANTHPLPGSRKSAEHFCASSTATLGLVPSWWTDNAAARAVTWRLDEIGEYYLTGPPHLPNTCQKEKQKKNIE